MKVSSSVLRRSPGGHWQQRNDIDDDGWADLAGYSRGIVRPRVFWSDGSGRTLFATGGAMSEERRGGTMPSAVLMSTGDPYPESLDTRRFDGGLVAQMPIADRYVLTARTSATRKDEGFSAVTFASAARSAAVCLSVQRSRPVPAGRHRAATVKRSRRSGDRPSASPARTPMCTRARVWAPIVRIFRSLQDTAPDSSACEKTKSAGVSGSRHTSPGNSAWRTIRTGRRAKATW